MARRVPAGPSRAWFFLTAMVLAMVRFRRLFYGLARLVLAWRDSSWQCLAGRGAAWQGIIYDSYLHGCLLAYSQ